MAHISDGQTSFFTEDELTPWKAEWKDMPEYDLHDLAPQFQLIVNFACAGDVEDFAALIGQAITPNNRRQLQSFWFPSQEIGRMVNKRYRAV